MELFKRLFRGRRAPTAQELLAYARDTTADLGGRDDAVLALSDFDLAEVEAALIEMTCDSSEEEMLIYQAGHALRIMWQ